jgi:glycosyltransferase involved in cell wall biosynthesis
MGIVVSNKIFGSGTYINDGVNGFVCEPTKEEFVEAVERYISDPSLLTTHAGQNRVIARKYSIHETARLHHELIETRLSNAG